MQSALSVFYSCKYLAVLQTDML